jgi:hypothetical protein
MPAHKAQMLTLFENQIATNNRAAKVGFRRVSVYQTVNLTWLRDEKNGSCLRADRRRGRNLDCLMTVLSNYTSPFVFNKDLGKGGGGGERVTEE